jgi:hypothetical protein
MPAEASRYNIRPIQEKHADRVPASISWDSWWYLKRLYSKRLAGNKCATTTKAPKQTFNGSYVTLYYITSIDSNNVSFNSCYVEEFGNIGVGIYQRICE